MSQDRSELSQEQALGEIRAEIDAIDQQIQQLVNQRARCAQRVAEVKAAFDQQDAIFYRPEREAQVLRRVMQRNTGPVPNAEVARLFREVMSICLALEQPLKILVPADPHGLSSQAALKHFGHSVQVCSEAAFVDLFQALLSGQADYAVVPIESEDSSQLSELIGRLSEHPVSFCGEVDLSADACPEAKMPAYRVIGVQYVAPSGADKTALLLSGDFEAADVAELIAGAGVEPLNLVIAQGSVNGGAQIYCELEGHQEQASVKADLDLLSGLGLKVKLLGSFPKAVL